MSPYNELRLRRLIGGLRAAEFVVECWEKAEYTTWKSWHLAHAKAVALYREYKLNSFLKHHGVGMRIRITDRRLIDFGISVGDVFLAFSSNHYGFMIEYKGSLLFVYRDECEVLV